MVQHNLSLQPADEPQRLWGCGACGWQNPHVTVPSHITVNLPQLKPRGSPTVGWDSSMCYCSPIHVLTVARATHKGSITHHLLLKPHCCVYRQKDAKNDNVLAIDKKMLIMTMFWLLTKRCQKWQCSGYWQKYASNDNVLAIDKKMLTMTMLWLSTIRCQKWQCSGYWQKDAKNDNVLAIDKKMPKMTMFWL